MQLVGWGSGTSTSCVAPHSAGAVLHAPNTALGVHRQPVRERPGLRVDCREYSPGREGAGVEVEVVGEDRVAEAFAEVEGAVVGAPAESVGADHRALQAAQLEARVEAVERAGG